MSGSLSNDRSVEPLSLRTVDDRGGDDDGNARLLSILQKAVSDAAEAVVVTEARLQPPGPRILWVNAAFAEITGYRRAEAVGQTPRILQGPETSAAVLRRLKQRLEAGKRFEGETVNYRKNGDEYINHWSIAPVHDEGGTIRYWVSIQRDVTEKRRLERDVLRVQEEERTRIGQELHDSVSSDLVSARMLLENVLERSGQNDFPREQLERVRQIIDRGYRDLRDVLQGLSPVHLSEESLEIALDTLSSQHPEVYFDQEEVDLDSVLAEWDTEALAHLYRIGPDSAFEEIGHPASGSLRNDSAPTGPTKEIERRGRASWAEKLVC